ncbi:hypothetical protein O9G_002515 [Rozella allomycis CSF55]|uniref:Uncharacterized protein n=1 Tax=Rozella allomycis (strain CSF55) TaxID=988480 RepID=A0A075AU60_ROZAC|nr:hypothetical protein O9G_002515 [Rozella allomycis CSF55]|eukprot:EPZ33803.1 hypothetical protein O9G_002515 [Rozella allomycis CSF55]
MDVISIICRHSANEEKIFNPNCVSIVFLNHIKKSCGFDDIPEQVDLATENGEVIDLQSKPKEYAKKYLEPRGTYILLKVVDDNVSDDSHASNYVPLIDQGLGERLKLTVSRKDGTRKRYTETSESISSNTMNINQGSAYSKTKQSSATRKEDGRSTAKAKANVPSKNK